MINAYWQELEFQIQEGTPKDWVRIVDTGLPSGEDFSEAGLPLAQPTYRLAPRSVVVLVRSRRSGFAAGA
jgi:glycogen operon protein